MLARKLPAAVYSGLTGDRLGMLPVFTGHLDTDRITHPLETDMPSTIDMSRGHSTLYVDGAASFRRERNWFLSFLMTPFKDMDQRAIDQAAAVAAAKRRAG